MAVRVSEVRYARLFNFPGRYENERIEVVIQLAEGEDPRTAWTKAYGLVHLLHETGEALRRFSEIHEEAWARVRNLGEQIRDAEADIGRYTAEYEKWKAQAEEERREQGRISRRALCQLGYAEEQLEKAKERLAELKQKRDWYEEMAHRAWELQEELDKAMQDMDFDKVRELLAGPVAEFMEAWHKGPSER